MLNILGSMLFGGGLAIFIFGIKQDYNFFVLFIGGFLFYWGLSLIIEDKIIEHEKKGKKCFRKSGLNQ